MKRFVAAVALAAFCVPSGVMAADPAPAAEIILDPAKLAVSRKIAARLVPPGALKQVLSRTMDSMMGSVLDQVMEMPVKDLALMSGISEETLNGAGPGKIREVTAILDPAFKERTRSGMNVIVAEMGTMMTKMEPEMREGMAEAYANQFSTAELADLQVFFETPSGMAFASKSLTLQTDPAFMKRMTGLVPQIMAAMPGIVKKAEAATAALPPIRQVADLSVADRQKLADLIGVKLSELDRKPVPVAISE